MNIVDIKATAKVAAQQIVKLGAGLDKLSSEKQIVENQLAQKIEKLAFEAKLFEYVMKIAAEGLIDTSELKNFAKNVREYSDEDITKIAQVDKILRQNIAKTGNNDIGKLEKTEFEEQINKE